MNAQEAYNLAIQKEEKDSRPNMAKIIESIMERVKSKGFEIEEWLVLEEVNELKKLGYKVKKLWFKPFYIQPQFTPSKQHKVYKITWTN